MDKKLYHSLTWREIQGLSEQVAKSLKISTEKDVSWLSQLFTAEKPCDWSGYNAREDRRSEVTSKPKTVVFGPLID